MALFEVPGWSISSDPVKDATVKTSKKRKRPADHDDEKLHTAQINLDKLMDTLKGEKNNDHEKPKRKRNKGQRAELGQLKKPDQISDSKDTERNKPFERKDDEDSVRKKPKDKKRKKKTDSDTQPLHPRTHGDPLVSNGLTTFQNRMKQSLDGARFRWINEMLYKSDSEHAVQVMREDPNMFQEYHTGFRHQVQGWPSNPVAHYISELESYPARTVIADLGCGDAALARALIPKGMIVLSYDLVTDGIYVTEADICGRIPLPGSEGIGEEAGVGEGHIVDVAVCALSLMGSNWPRCIREAWRTLKPGGELKIAEVTSRFTNVDQFLSLISSIGFKFISKDDSNTHFMLFEFKKVVRKDKNERDWSKIMSKGSLLKACEYKRR